MTLFLASVTGPEEAEVALKHGADIIDLKDPGSGALGAAPPDAVRATIAVVGGRRPVSAVTGDLPMQPDIVVAAVEAMAATGVDYIKVGLFPGSRREDCVRALAALARTGKIVGVMFADRGADNALLAVMAESGFAGAMLDTAGKGAGRLLQHADITTLNDFVAACRGCGLLAGLAGSLETPDIPRLLLLEPDYLGFRRALCAGQERTGRIDAEAVGIVRALIPLDARSAARHDTHARKVDYRLLAMRSYSFDAGKEPPSDRVFVRDFLLPVRIGAYAHEHEKPQRVRFDVEVKVFRPSHAVEDMRDVFSYDVILDGIRMLVAREHFALIETLAERIAAFILAHPRVNNVTVRVEKLEVGPGGVGVEITRERPADVAHVHHLYPAAAGEIDPKAGS
jgi:(5-formylfuran-3-yl)methyl phosphate synthase